MENIRNVTFDVARSMAMMYIVGIHHVSEYVGGGGKIIDFPVLHSFVWASLGVFTFLSGYLLGGKYDFRKKYSVRNFYKKRLLRIYPLFLVSSLLLVAIGMNEWPETLKGLCGIGMLMGKTQNTLWYIAMILLLYLITPLFASDKKWKQLMWLFVAYVILFAVQLTNHSVHPRMYYYTVIFWCGIFIAKNYPNLLQKIMNWKWSLLFLIVLISAEIVLMKTGGMQVLKMAAGYCGIPTLLCLSHYLTKFMERKEWFGKWVIYLSYGSMCAYMFHREIYWLALQIWTPDSVGMTWGYMVSLAFPITLFVGYWIQKSYDNLVRKF